MKLNEFVSESEQQQLDELVPAVLGALAKGAAAVGSAAVKGGAQLARSVGTGIAKTAGSLSGAAATPTGAAAQQAADAQQGQDQQAIGPIDIINAIKDPKVAMQLKAMKQKIPGGNLDAMVDPKGAADQQKQIQDLSKALDTLKKNAGIK